MHYRIISFVGLAALFASVPCLAGEPSPGGTPADVLAELAPVDCDTGLNLFGVSAEASGATQAVIPSAVESAPELSEFLEQLSADQRGRPPRRKYCVCGCGITCVNDADCGPGGRCVSFITCC